MFPAKFSPQISSFLFSRTYIRRRNRENNLAPSNASSSHSRQLVPRRFRANRENNTVKPLMSIGLHVNSFSVNVIGDMAAITQQQRTPRRRGPGRPFQRGVSGNPSGRPKVVGEVRELARSYTVMAIGTLVNIAADRKAPPAARVSAATALLDRGYGRPEQAIAVASLPVFAGEVNISDPIEATRAYEQMMAGTLALDAISFEVRPNAAPEAAARAQSADQAPAVGDPQATPARAPDAAIPP